MRTIQADTAFENCDNCKLFELESNELLFIDGISHYACRCAHKRICLNAVKIYEEGKKNETLANSEEE